MKCAFPGSLHNGYKRCCFILVVLMFFSRVYKINLFGYNLYIRCSWKHIIHGNLWLHLTRKTPSSWSVDDQKQALTLLLSYHKFIITRPMTRSQCDNGCSINATTYISYLAKTVEQRQHCDSDGSHLSCLRILISNQWGDVLFHWWKWWMSDRRRQTLQ